MGVVQNSLDVVKMVGRIANPELLEKVTSLNEQVLELSSKNVELQQLLFQREKEHQQAHEKLQFIGEAERIADYIYRKGELEPCCPRCFDVDRRLVHIVESRDPKIGIHPFCPQCKTMFATYPKGLRGRG